MHSDTAIDASRNNARISPILSEWALNDVTMPRLPKPKVRGSSPLGTASQINELSLGVTLALGRLGSAQAARLQSSWAGVHRRRLKQ